MLDVHYSHNVLGNKEVTGVHTERGFIKTKCVVNCGGNYFINIYFIVFFVSKVHIKNKHLSYYLSRYLFIYLSRYS